MKKDFVLDKIKQSSIFVIGGAKSNFNPQELDILRQFLEEGGSMLIFQGEGGDAKYNTNLNEFLKDYGITFHGDSVVRTSYFKYPHPKECFIDTMKVHPEFLRSIKNVNKQKKIDLLDNDDDDAGDDALLKIIYPFGQSLDTKENVSVIFNSGIIAYPLNRPLCAVTTSKSGKGKLCVIGSLRFIDNDYIDKEENRKVMEG